MWLLDKLDKLLPGRQTYSIRKQYVDEYMKRAVPLLGANIISPEQARRELGIDDPYMEWATRSEYQWRDREQKGKCLWCTTPYEDDSGSCTKCGAPKEQKKSRFDNVVWRC